MNNEIKEGLHKRWLLLCNRLNEFPGANVNAEKWWKILDDHYSEPHRAYHNWDHIDDCFREFDEVIGLFEAPLAAELALFFHDAIYEVKLDKPKRFTNEIASANLLREFCRESRMGGIMARLVYCTDHDPQRLPTMTEDEKLICSIDLAILGQLWPRYATYTWGVRQEYQEVPLDIYRKERAKILEGFLNRKTIFPSIYFKVKYELKARKNITFERQQLLLEQFPKE